jgi:crotonobetainyl-CoA:carnitine CoA-transferase CaiB-like acyl-CoA transferase
MRRLGPARHPDMAAFFLNVNRNKRSIVLDLKNAEAHGALMRLVDTADVFVHNMRAPAAERLGLGAAAIMARNPRIVHAAATGFRQDGPWRDRPAYDDVIQGMSGMASLYEKSTGEPRYVPMAFADKLCGVSLASAIGMALFRRERTGRGEAVHLPMYETVLSFNLLDHMWTFSLAGGGDGIDSFIGYPRTLSRHRRPYPTQDGFICLLATTDEQWRRLFAVFDRPEMVRDARFRTLPERSANIDALYTLLAEMLGEHSTAECQRRLEQADVPSGPMLDAASLPEDPYLRETEFFQDVTHPTEGKLHTPSIPVAFAEAPGTIRRHAPGLGEHTEEVLRDLGYGAEKISAIVAAGAARR